jgi:hypothetical protein
MPLASGEVRERRAMPPDGHRNLPAILTGLRQRLPAKRRRRIALEDLEHEPRLKVEPLVHVVVMQPIEEAVLIDIRMAPGRRQPAERPDVEHPSLLRTSSSNPPIASRNERRIRMV